MSDPLPPTADATQALRDLAQHGAAILTGVLSPSGVANVRKRLMDGIPVSEADGVPTRNYAFDPDSQNQRVFHLFNLDPVFVEIVRHPEALRFVQQQLGEDFLISNFSANITSPGNQRMQLHADQGYVPGPWPARPLACNVAWLLDDFTEENGGTCFVPGSHLLGHGPDPADPHQTIAIEAPAGSLLVMDGRVWHQTGENRSLDCQRAALFGYYVQRWIRPQINWNAALWPATARSLDPGFLHLLGYYSGNVEFQIPNGLKSQVRPPATLDGNLKHFALGPKA